MRDLLRHFFSSSEAETAATSLLAFRPDGPSLHRRHWTIGPRRPGDFGPFLNRRFQRAVSGSRFAAPDASSTRDNTPNMLEEYAEDAVR